ncbi:putative lipoprotein [[Clostridium] bifermentans ATCC 638]|uniref:Putative lipoprotein n=1 Tax=Paraclostridium bifermentans ATCC 638 = DSM 14991 TaxID=1233171 RepID=T4VNC5_PARBF|nr:hypothetical protein [Paraclostridium bifermentans]EQK42620.1 putative lipoprotein [[Clostridium] bifermentans ATCC 638] [Paraclostridium bifermentans ATCC 638 = DSM 14991]RIZ60122.1 hypothetical protein CHH45_04185 [Paraclostridium bifermentans]UAG19425.1 hypothetical protein KXZ80_06895 [Paraclostridium bifermentans]
MNIKIYKKLAIVLTLSIVIFSATGCEALGNFNLFEKSDSEKHYSISSILEDAASAFENITSDVIGYTKDFIGDKDFREGEIEKIKEIPNEIKDNIDIFEKNSNGFGLNENNMIVKWASDVYQTIKDSIGNLVDGIKI